MNVLKVSIFTSDPDKAIAFCTRIFHLDVVYSIKGPDGQSSYTVLLQNGNYFCSVVQDPDMQPETGFPIQIDYGVSTQKELAALFEQLKVNGNVTREPAPMPFGPMGAAVTDQFGVNWFLIIPPEGDTPEGWNS